MGSSCSLNREANAENALLQCRPLLYYCFVLLVGEAECYKGTILFDLGFNQMMAENANGGFYPPDFKLANHMYKK